MDALRLDASLVDYLLVAAYSAVVLLIGFAARRRVSDSLDFFLSGRSLPAWVTGLASISANLGAVEIIGMSANGAQYGFATRARLLGDAEGAAHRPRRVCPGTSRPPSEQQRRSGRDRRRGRAAGAYDVRNVIAGLIGFYGVVLVIVGLVGDSEAELAKTGGVAANLWAGIGMLVFAAAFALWSRLRPVLVDPGTDVSGDDDRPPGR